MEFIWVLQLAIRQSEARVARSARLPDGTSRRDIRGEMQYKFGKYGSMYFRRVNSRATPKALKDKARYLRCSEHGESGQRESVCFALTGLIKFGYLTQCFGRCASFAQGSTVPRFQCLRRCFGSTCGKLFISGIVTKQKIVQGGCLLRHLNKRKR
jgi:hypothetical protein